MKIFPTLIFLAFILNSCDPVYYARINNKTNDTVTLEIHFDKSEIQSVWGERPFLPYLYGSLNGGGSVSKFDTVSLIANIILNPNESFYVKRAVGFQPDYFGIKKILIFKSDTIVLDNKKSMMEAFEETDTRQFNFNIK